MTWPTASCAACITYLSCHDWLAPISSAFASVRIRSLHLTWAICTSRITLLYNCGNFVTGVLFLDSVILRPGPGKVWLNEFFLSSYVTVFRNSPIGQRRLPDTSFFHTSANSATGPVCAGPQKHTYKLRVNISFNQSRIIQSSTRHAIPCIC